jgi:hypothetical protein
MLVAALVSSDAHGLGVRKTREFSATVSVLNSVQLLNRRAKQVHLCEVFAQDNDDIEDRLFVLISLDKRVVACDR